MISGISVNLTKTLCTGLVQGEASVNLKRNEKRCKQTALCPPEANKALAVVWWERAAGGLKGLSAEQCKRVPKKSIYRLILERASSFGTSTAINLHITYFRDFFFF